jgi:hypothetical protein
MANRAEVFGKRMLLVQGGNYQPIYSVQANSIGANASRGVRGDVAYTISQLYPQPQVKKVTTQMIETSGNKLQDGDYYLNVLPSQISREFLVADTTYIKIGGSSQTVLTNELFRIVKFDEVQVAGLVAYFNIYIRGAK